MRACAHCAAADARRFGGLGCIAVRSCETVAVLEVREAPMHRVCEAGDKARRLDEASLDDVGMPGI